MIDKIELTKVVEEYISDKEMFLVDITVSPDNEIVVSVDSDNAIDIDSCIALTRHIESIFDRDVEDYELEVGSAGLSSPFKVLRQYKKYEGQEVEVLSKAGEKLTGVLADVNDANFTVVTVQKVKPEGSKRKVEVEVKKTFAYDEVKYTKYVINFK